MSECRDDRIPGILNRMAEGRTQGCQDPRMCVCQIGCKAARMPRCRDVMVPECQDAMRSGCQDAKMSEFTIKCRISGCQDARISVCKMQGGHHARNPGCQGARLPGCQVIRIPGCQDVRAPSRQDAMMLGTQSPGCHDVGHPVARMP